MQLPPTGIGLALRRGECHVLPLPVEDTELLLAQLEESHPRYTFEMDIDQSREDLFASGWRVILSFHKKYSSHDSWVWALRRTDILPGASNYEAITSMRRQGKGLQRIRKRQLEFSSVTE